MLKNKLDYKLINLALLTFIIFLLYQTNGLWLSIFEKLFKILFPFLIAFSMSYALYPYTKKLQEKKIPKGISIFIVVLIVLVMFGFIFITVAPLLVEQLGSLFNGILEFIKEIQMKYDLDFGPLQTTLTDTFNNTIKEIGMFISNGLFSVISTSFSYLSTAIITISASIYFLIDMDNIREGIKKHYQEKGKKKYYFVKELDTSMKNYLDGFLKIMIITLIEYFIAYKFIGHPNALLLAFLACFANLIPYFGGLFTNIIAIITAFVVSPQLFVRTLIVFLIFSAVDSYIINPFVYGKTNELHPILVILSVFAGGILFGIVGIMISLPVTILILTTYNYYKKDVKNKITKMKEAI